MRAPLPAWFDEAVARLGEDEVRMRLGILLGEQVEPPPVEAPGLRVEIGRAAVGGLIEVRLWTTAKEAVEMSFGDLGELEMVEDIYGRTGLYRAEADARRAMEAAEEARQEAKAARAPRHATDDELQRRASAQRDAFFGGATLPADWRDRRKP